MALLLVHIQNLPDLAGKRRVYLGKAVGTIFVYGAFADAKLSGSLTHGCVFFNDKPPGLLFLQCMPLWPESMTALSIHASVLPDAPFYG